MCRISHPVACHFCVSWCSFLVPIKLDDGLLTCIGVHALIILKRYNQFRGRFMHSVWEILRYTNQTNNKQPSQKIISPWLTYLPSYLPFKWLFWGQILVSWPSLVSYIYVLQSKTFEDSGKGFLTGHMYSLLLNHMCQQWNATSGPPSSFVHRLHVTGPKGHRSESVGKLNSVGIGGLALTRAARDSSPHSIQRLTDLSTVTFILWTEDTIKFLQLEFF